MARKKLPAALSRWSAALKKARKQLGPNAGRLRKGSKLYRLARSFYDKSTPMKRGSRKRASPKKKKNTRSRSR